MKIENKIIEAKLFLNFFFSWFVDENDQLGAGGGEGVGWVEVMFDLQLITG